MLSLITDRTYAHVELLKKLNKMPYKSMTLDEQNSWMSGEAAKGAYNYTDLNRVESAVAEIAARMGLNLTTKTDWTLADIPDQTDMSRYLGNVVAIRDACPGDTEFPTLPDNMSGLDYRGANNIEKVLFIANELTSGVLGKGVLGTMVLGKEL